MPVLTIQLAVLPEFFKRKKILKQTMTILTWQIMLVWIIHYAGVSEKVEMCKKNCNKINKIIM